MTQFEEIFAALQSAGARYVVVGGVAVNLHGYQRFTKDLDLVVELVPDNTRRALEALQALGYKPSIPVKASDIADPEIRASWIRDKGMMVFQMYSNRSRVTVDIFVEHPIPFDALWTEADTIDLPAAKVRIASIEHLTDEAQRVPPSGYGRHRKAGTDPRAAGRHRGGQVKHKSPPAPGSFEAAELFQFKLALQATPAQRLQDLEDMIDFNVRAEELNPRLREVVQKLRQ